MYVLLFFNSLFNFVFISFNFSAVTIVSAIYSPPYAIDVTPTIAGVIAK